MFCEQCGMKLSDDAKFCTNCGIAIKKTSNINVVGVSASKTETVQPKAEPVVAVEEPVAEQIEEPVVPLEEPVTEQVEEPVAEQIEEPVVAVEESVAEPVIAPVEKTIVESFVEPVAVVEEPSEIAVDVKSNFETVAVADESTYNQPAQPDLPPKEEPVRKGRKIVSRIFSVIICIMLFVTSLATVGVMTVREVLDEDTMSDIVDDIDIETYIDDGAFDEVLGEDTKKEDIEEIYETGTFKEYLKEVLADYGNYMLTGQSPEGIKYKEVEDVVKDNEKLIYEVTGHKVSKNDYKRIKDYVENDAEKHLGMLMSDKVENSPIKAVRLAISIYVVIGLIAVSLLFAALLFIIRKVKTNGFLWCGVTLALSSIVFALAGFLMPMFLNFGDDAILAAVKSILEDNVVVKFFINGAIMLATSVLLILIYVIIRIIKNFKAKRA